MATRDYELVILGHGSAAFAAAIKANELPVTTAMIGTNETNGTLLGGTCVNVGCVPSKNLLFVGSSYFEAVREPFEAVRYGKTKLDFAKAIAEKDTLVRKFRKEKYLDVLKNLTNVEYIQGEGRFISKDEVKVGRRTISGRKFLIATGARASIPRIEGIESVNHLTNEEALNLRKLPKSMIVVGGRALGLEFAQMYAHFGSKVTLLQRSHSILPDYEPEISSSLSGYLKEEGIRIYTGVELEGVSQSGGMKSVRTMVNGVRRKFEAEELLFATGRTPNTDRLESDKAGVTLDEKGFVKVNEEMQTTAPHVWAAGDATGEPMLETVAAKEGSLAVNNAFSGSKKHINFTEVPKAVFTYPEVASVGLTEAETNGHGIKCACGILPMDFVPKANITGDTRGLVKLVADNQTKQIVGVHIVAPHAADLIHEGVLAVKYKLTVDDIIDTVHVFPTLSESIKLAAQSFYRDVGSLSCCIE
ncbi:MAG TPA: mercury(II) reductase [Nitrososphaerales archaeon]|nr:mercury(II) reductase [Nitrososphaerales archaeon]